MMKKTLTRITLGLLALSAASVVSAQSAEDMIKFRQSGYTFMSWNMGTIKAHAVDGSVEFNAAQVQAAANSLAAIANSGMGALYAPGTDQGTGWKPTRLKSSFFEEQQKVGEIAVNFVQQANKLQEVAATGDKAAIAAQFGEVGKACKACHDNYRISEK
jgi:cytochrome c556